MAESLEPSTTAARVMANVCMVMGTPQGYPDGDLGHHGDDGGEQSGVADIADRKFRALGVFGSRLTR